MSLTIEYRPFTLPTAPVPAAAGGRMAAVASALAGPALRPRDFTARIRRRNTVSARRALAAPPAWRRRFGGMALAGLIALALGPLGWGAAGGIGPAHAEAGAGKLEPFETPDESFPGPAIHQVDPLDGGPVAPIAASSLDRSHRDDEEPARFASAAGPAARPLVFTGSALDRSRALKCLTAAVYYESASEPGAGQRAVAQVVLNRVAHPAFPDTVCGVVYQGSGGTGCQFSFACDGAMARQPVPAAWDRARRIAADALAGIVYAPVGLSTHYHTTAVHPAWDGRMTLAATIGAHRFYRWPGAAGRPAAFDAVYTGHEPLAAPHPRTTAPAPDDDAVPAVLEQAWDQGSTAEQAISAVPATVTTAPAPAPGDAPAVQSRSGDSLHDADKLPGSGAVQPGYENSGRWIGQPAAG